MIKIPYYETSHFVFSNFSPHAVIYKGVLYSTVEHAFHASKFDDEKIKEEIRNAKSPLEAFMLGSKYEKRENWREVKTMVMYEILKEKVTQHQEVREALLATDDEEIVEENPHDDFWGGGPDGNGQNHTGKILMKIRDELQKVN